MCIYSITDTFIVIHFIISKTYAVQNGLFFLSSNLSFQITFLFLYQVSYSHHCLFFILWYFYTGVYGGNNVYQ